MPKGYPAKAGDCRADKKGRVLVKCLNHEVFGTRWVLRSHMVWWKLHGQLVARGWHLHHKDENRSNDTGKNLKLMLNSEHTALHMNKPSRKLTVSNQAKTQYAEGKFGSATWTTAGKAKLRDSARKQALRQHACGKFGSSTWTEEGKSALSRASSERAKKMHAEKRFGVHAWKVDPSKHVKELIEQGKFGHAKWTKETHELVSVNATFQHALRRNKNVQF